MPYSLSSPLVRVRTIQLEIVKRTRRPRFSGPNKNCMYPPIFLIVREGTTPARFFFRQQFEPYMHAYQWTFGTFYPEQCFFFCGIYRKMGVAKMCRLEKFQIFQISNASIFFRRPFQTKNPRDKTKISARCARQHKQGGGKNKRKSFLIFVSSDRSPQKVVFRVKQRLKQSARSARKIYRVFTEKQSPKCAG